MAGRGIEVKRIRRNCACDKSTQNLVTFDQSYAREVPYYVPNQTSRGQPWRKLKLWKTTPI
jgi:hypothetical protein